MIYFIIGLIIGIIGTYFWVSRKNNKASTPDSARESGLTSELIEEKQKNLEKARAFIKGKTKITNDDLQKALGVSDATIVRYLNDLESEGLIKQVGKTGKYTYYEIKG